MPDSPYRATSFPLLSLPALLALAFVAGRFATHKLALETARPEAKTSFLEVQRGEVLARLWQDPLRATQDDAHDPRGGGRLKCLTTRLRTKIEQRCGKDEAREVLVLPVFIPGQPYPRDVETRLRTRYAVLAGLYVAGYKAKDARHIHYFAMPRKRRDPGSEVDKQEDPNKQVAPRPYWVVPYEWFDKSEFDAGYWGGVCEVGGNTSRCQFDYVLLLWVNEYELHGKPLHGLARILTDLGVQRDEITVSVRVLGPTNSDTLFKMWREEKKAESHPWAAWEPALDGAIFYSPRATVCDDFIKPLPHPESNRAEYNAPKALKPFCALDLFSGPSRVVVGNTDLRDLCNIPEPNDTGLGPGPAEKPESAVWLSDENGTFEFERTIASDDETCERLVEELALREADPADPRNHILLIMEWDTHYGRALLETFAAVIRRRVCVSRCDPQFAHL